MKPPLFLARTALLTVVAIPLGAQETEAKHLLRHMFQTGKSQFYRQTMVAENKTNVGDQTMAMNMTMETIVELKVVAVKDGKAELQETIHRVVMKATGPLEVDYDSDIEGSDPGPMKEVVGQAGTSITFKMDERGRTSDLKPPEEGERVRGGVFGRSATEQLVQVMPEFPDAPVAIGGSWEETVLMPGMVSQADGKVTHKLVAVEKGKARIAYQTAVDMDKITVPPGAKMEISKCGGSLVVDLATGSLLEGRMEMVLKMSMAGGPRKMDMEAAHQMTLVAIDPPAPKKAKKVEQPAAVEPGEGKK